MSEWKTIDSAPKKLVHPAADTAEWVFLKFSQYEDWDNRLGYFSPREGCFRYEGDDGADDVQPTHWKKIYYGTDTEKLTLELDADV